MKAKNDTERKFSQIQNRIRQLQSTVNKLTPADIEKLSFDNQTMIKEQIKENTSIPVKDNNHNELILQSLLNGLKVCIKEGHKEWETEFKQEKDPAEQNRQLDNISNTLDKLEKDFHKLSKAQEQSETVSTSPMQTPTTPTEITNKNKEADNFSSKYNQSSSSHHASLSSSEQYEMKKELYKATLMNIAKKGNMAEVTAHIEKHRPGLVSSNPIKDLGKKYELSKIEKEVMKAVEKEAELEVKYPTGPKK